MRVCIRALLIALLLGGCTHHVTTKNPSAPPRASRATARPQIAASIAPTSIPALVSAPPAIPAPQHTSVATPAPAFLFFPSPHPYALVTPQPISIPAFLEPLPMQRSRPLVISTPSIPQLAPDAAPQIVSIELPTDVVNGGDVVTGDVIASSNVASVEVRLAGYGRSMEKTGPGHFTISIAVPRLPFFLRHRTYTLIVIARNTRGDAVVQTLPITLR